MAIAITYGDYTFPANTTTVQPMSREYTRDARGERMLERQTWTVRTMLTGANASAIDTAIGTFETAMTDGSALALGSTHHSVSDCRVLSISYPDLSGPEFANRRTAEVVFEGYVERSDTNEISFSESLVFSGGGARYVWQETISGIPKKTQVAENTVYRCTQSGSARKYAAYPSPPGPVFPGHEVEGNPRTRRTTERDDDGNLIYVLDWVYEFASSHELTGSPGTWQ